MTIKAYIKKIGGLLVITAIMMALSMVIASSAAENDAAPTSVEVTEVNFENSTITVKLNAADTALLISDSKQKKWEYVPSAKDAEGLVVLDISWISMTKDYVLSLKGDASKVPVTVTIPMQQKNFKATYSTSNGGTISFQGVSGPIEWKKKESRIWERFPVDASGNPDTASFARTLQGLCSNGATLLFRVAPKNGTGTNPGARASREVSVNVSKKTAAPSINIDDEKMTIPVTKDMQYRYCDKYGNPGDDTSWNDFSKTYDCPLSFIASRAMYDSLQTAEDVYVQFRTAASSTKQVSFITTVCIPAQEDLSQAAKTNIKISYTSTTTFQIEIPTASSDEPYEYCIINQNDVMDGVTISSVDEIKWKSVNSTDPVSISEERDKVENGSKVYVRRKAYKSLGDDEYRLASPTIFLGDVTYPKDITTLQSLVWLQTVAGKCNEGNSEGKLSFSFYSETNSPITEIQFVDYSSKGTKRGEPLKINVDFNSVVSENAEYDSSVESGDDSRHYRYIINTSIFSTKKVDFVASNNNQRAMLANIKIKDSTEYFQSDSEKGIALYLHQATTVNNPQNNSKKTEIASLLGWSDYDVSTDHIAYSTSFERIFNSKRIFGVNNGYEDYNSFEKCDPVSFRVRLDFGTRYVPKSGTQGAVESGDSNKVVVTKIKYDNVEFLAGETDAQGKKYFDVEYADIIGSAEGDSGDLQRMAVMTVNVDVIEKDARIDDRDKETPLIVYLSNGEILDDDIKINLKNTAVVVDYRNHTQGAQSLTLNSLLKTEDVTKTTVNGETQTVTTEHPDDNHIALRKISADYDVSLDRVTWSGHQICKNIGTESEYITMDISNELMNNVYRTVTPGSSESAYLVFEFDNGFVISSGWKITINRPATDSEG